jgi:hypothetical protein
MSGCLAFIDADTRARHRDRALEAIAKYLCEARWTDGFCNGSREGCKCRSAAHAILVSLEIRGVIPVWEFDRALTAAGRIPASRED